MTTSRRVHLPVIAPQASSLPGDGSRAFVYPADVRGRFTTLRRVVFVALIAMWVALPLVRVGGKPAVFLDVGRRQFHLLGAVFNAQDIWLLFFLLTGVAFAVVALTTLLGRVWCGYACPQTVFLEAFFRPIERITEGPRDKRIRLARAPWSVEKVLRKGAKHGLFVFAAFFVAHVFVSYFVSVPALAAMVAQSPADHPEVFAWAAALTGLFYVNFAWFREQLCVVICPYGRLQSVLLDDDSLVVGYDARRGEPRGKRSDETAGDCVDCRRCVAVCPTGIDIRNGLQLDCIACTACVDACDDIMTKLGRAPGLVRYDSLRGLAGQPRRILRPRLYLYAAFLAVGLVVAGFALRSRHAFEATLLRQRGVPFVVDAGQIRNAFEIQIVNKQDRAVTFVIQPVAPSADRFVLPSPEVELAPLDSRKVPLLVTMPRDEYHGEFEFILHVLPKGTGDAAAPPTSEDFVVVRGHFLGPSS